MSPRRPQAKRKKSSALREAEKYIKDLELEGYKMVRKIEYLEDRVKELETREEHDA